MSRPGAGLCPARCDRRGRGRYRHGRHNLLLQRCRRAAVRPPARGDARSKRHEALGGAGRRGPGRPHQGDSLAGERWSGQFRVRRHSGSTLVVRITNTPVMEQGQVVGVIGVGPAACRADAPRYGDLCRDRAGQGHVDRCPRVPTRSSVSDAVGVLATQQPQASRHRHRDGRKRDKTPSVKRPAARLCAWCSHQSAGQEVAASPGTTVVKPRCGC